VTFLDGILRLFEAVGAQLPQLFSSVEPSNGPSLYAFAAVAARYSETLCADLDPLRVLLLVFIGSELDYDEDPAVRRFLAEKGVAVDPVAIGTRIGERDHIPVDSLPKAGRGYKQRFARMFPAKGSRVLFHALALSRRLTDFRVFDVVYKCIRPWLPNISFARPSHVRDIFQPIFIGLASPAIRYAVIHRYFRPYLDNLSFVGCLVENLPWPVQSWLMIVDAAEKPEIVIQWMIASLIRKRSSVFHDVLFQCFAKPNIVPNTQDATDYLLFLLRRLRDDSVISNLIHKLTLLRGAECELGHQSPETGITYLACTDNAADFDAVLEHLRLVEVSVGAFMRAVAFACASDSPFAKRLLLMAFELYPKLSARLASVLLKTDDAQLAEVGLQNAADNLPAVVDAVTRGILPLSALAGFRVTGRGPEEFWVRAAKSGKGHGFGPTPESVRNAVCFGGSEIIKVIDEAIPRKIKPESIWPYMMTNFENTWVLAGKLPASQFDQIPEIEEVPRGVTVASAEFAGMLIALATE
jgi:hypothetical protein